MVRDSVSRSMREHSLVALGVGRNEDVGRSDAAR
jgi:hypothetical protein